MYTFLEKKFKLILQLFSSLFLNWLPWSVSSWWTFYHGFDFNFSPNTCFVCAVFISAPNQVPPLEGAEEENGATNNTGKSKRQNGLAPHASMERKLLKLLRILN